MGDMRTVLVVARETIGGDRLADAVRVLASEAPTHFHLLVPEPPTSASVAAAGVAAIEAGSSAFTEDPSRHSSAEERLRRGLDWLRGLGVAADGEVGATDPAIAVAEVVERAQIDSVLLSTLPSRWSRWLHQDLTHRIERRCAVPVTTVTAHDLD